jgi:protein TonB
MFDLITGATKHAPRHQIVPILVSIAAHTAVAGTILVGTVLFVREQLPEIPTMMAFVAVPPAPPLPPPPSPAPAPPKTRSVAANPVPTSGDVAPVAAPPQIVPEAPAADVDEAELAGGEGGVPGGVPGGVVGGFAAEIPPPPPPPRPVPRGPIRIGGQIQQPTLVHRVDPVYPAIAISAGIEGTVILEAIVDEEGRVENLKVLRSNGVLDRPALEAVRQWRYSPVLLDGRPEKFILTVVVSFRFTDVK